MVLERREVGATNAFLPFLLVGLFAIGLRVVMSGSARRRRHRARGAGPAARGPAARLDRAGCGWAAPVTLEGLLAAAYEGMRLAAILACLGATNALASPRRLLRYVPATLYEVGTAVVVALTFAPQMVEDAARVRAARRLRGHTGRGIREMGRLAVPVLVGSLERSLSLAASMESRGYGRAGATDRRAQRGSPAR